jgi:hypothetical protein
MIIQVVIIQVMIIQVMIIQVMIIKVTSSLHVLILHARCMRSVAIHTPAGVL